jgi:hypothetical protein
VVGKMAQPTDDTMRRLARRYVWWKTPDDTLIMPERVAAQVMNIGDYDDVQALVALVGDDYPRDVLRRAEIGQFSARSWAYWHYRLGLAEPEKVPPMPSRRFG